MTLVRSLLPVVPALNVVSRLARLSLLFVLLTAVPLMAQRPAKTRPFSVLARAASFTAAFIPNRTYCSVAATGFFENSSSLATCLWPANSPNMYLFSAGPQVAGIVGADGGVWAGDTTGGFFFDSKGTTEHGEKIAGVFLSNRDSLEWPAEARVPAGGGLFPAASGGKNHASPIDAWSMAWEGNSGLRAGRAHPLGVAIETRNFGWPYPRGNDDIQYVAYTIYNITATDPAAYAVQRPEIRARLQQLGERFHASAQAQLGATLPAGGYTIESWYAAFGADMDVGDASSNFLSINTPLATLFGYDADFSPTFGWRFDLQDYASPFFAGAGFYGMTVLQAPDGSSDMHMGTMTINGTPWPGVLNDPRDIYQLYRTLAGARAAPDTPCRYDVLSTRLCYLTDEGQADVRGTLGVRGVPLPPGGSATFAIAQTFSAPYGPGRIGNIGIGDPLRVSDPAALATGANTIDSITGFLGYSDRNNDGVVQGSEIQAAPRSVLGKAQLARALFQTHFLLPTAPETPEFFVVPGDNAVSVLWKPSRSETTGDPFFATASQPMLTTVDGTAPNPLYDPNFRQFDVEGYRVYRSRTADFREATLLRQFDYAGTTMRDYTGRIQPTAGCAPEFGLRSDCSTLDSLIPGVTATRFEEHDIVGQIIQVREGDRFVDGGRAAFVIQSDTFGDWGYDQNRCLCNQGVPFLFTDSTARNGILYYYAVTAFDVNSLQSAPSSMESLRVPRAARPVRPAVNQEHSGSIAITFEGRGRVLDPSLPIPALDAATAQFSGPFPPANGWEAQVRSFLPAIFQGEAEARVRLDSVSLGQPASTTPAFPSIPVRYHFSATVDGVRQELTIPIVQTAIENFSGTTTSARGRIDIQSSDPGLAQRYGGDAQPLKLELLLQLRSTGFMGNWGRHAANFGFGGETENGIRWFDGPSPARNETMMLPNSANCFQGSGCVQLSITSNAGQLSGVSMVYQPISYIMIDREWRDMDESLAGARRAADYNVYWGAGGLIDSVIDITHNVPVPFSPRAGGTWGILNTTAQGAGGFDTRPDVLTPTDWTCVEPFRSGLSRPGSGFYPCSSAVPFALSQRAALGRVAFSWGSNQTSGSGFGSVRNPSNLSSSPGFALYIAGAITHFGLDALPPAGTVWSLRDYIGFIQGTAGFLSFNGFGPRPWTAVGTEIVVRTEAANQVFAARDADLRRAHPVPDPFYYQADHLEGNGIRFVNLPTRATIRIYSAGGILLRLLDHQPASQQGDTFWDLRTRNGQRVASGVYFYHIESGDARRVGRMTIVNYTN